MAKFGDWRTVQYLRKPTSLKNRAVRGSLASGVIEASGESEASEGKDAPVLLLDVCVEQRQAVRAPRWSVVPVAELEVEAVLRVDERRGDDQRLYHHRGHAKGRLRERRQSALPVSTSPLLKPKRHMKTHLTSSTLAS